MVKAWITWLLAAFLVMSVGCGGAFPYCSFDSSGAYEAHFSTLGAGMCNQDEFANLLNAQVYQGSETKYGALITLPLATGVYNFGDGEEEAAMIITDALASCSSWEGTATFVSLPPGWEITVDATCATWDGGMLAKFSGYLE